MAIPLIIVFVLLFIKEPRSIWPGVFFTLTLFATFSIVAFMLSIAFSLISGSLYLVVVLAIAMVLAAAPLILGAFLTANMFILWRKEGRSLAGLTSGGIGAFLFIYTGFFYHAVFTAADAGSFSIFQTASVGLFPLVAFVGLAFVSFISYSVFYEWYFRRFGKRADAVIVLGAQVRDPNSLTPLLRSRVDRGIEVLNKSIASGKDPVLVLSGGQGPDEPCPEAVAMANYAIEAGVDKRRILVEDKSKSTEDNLALSSELLKQSSLVPENPRIAVASSDYHAFRGALMMKEAGLDGYATGARTARYYWPSAKVREFIAIVVDNKWPVLVCAVLAALAGLVIATS